MCNCLLSVEWALGFLTGEQRIQGLCVQPGEGLSSGEDVEQQQPCQI